jgi:hypothetical protein
MPFYSYYGSVCCPKRKGVLLTMQDVVSLFDKHTTEQ